MRSSASSSSSISISTFGPPPFSNAHTCRIIKFTITPSYININININNPPILSLNYYPRKTRFSYSSLPLLIHFINTNNNNRKNHLNTTISSYCSSNLSFPDMDASGDVGLYPLHRSKTLHLVRHAQGFHNVAGEKDPKLYMSYDYLDASLTPLGWQQVDNLRKHVQAIGLPKTVELVITSPLTRTMQTAIGVFGGGGCSDGVDAPPLMVADAVNSGRPAISSLDCPPFLAVELCREHLGVHPCDKRRSKREYQTAFPAVDFSLIESDEDALWKEDVRERDEEVAERGMKFMKWLWTRKEKEIAIVSHSGFLFNTLAAFGNDCHQVVKEEICTLFKNCELRSMVFVDKGLASSDSPTTNFPGKVPNGPDLPSDVADEKLA